jgi:hypothetical protein
VRVLGNGVKAVFLRSFEASIQKLHLRRCVALRGVALRACVRALLCCVIMYCVFGSVVVGVGCCLWVESYHAVCDFSGACVRSSRSLARLLARALLSCVCGGCCWWCCCCCCVCHLRGDFSRACRAVRVPCRARAVRVCVRC